MTERKQIYKANEQLGENICITYKGLIFLIYRGLTKQKVKKPITHRKVDKSTDRQFTEKCIPMADKHLKRYAASLVTQEMLNNNRFFFPPRKFAKMKTI